MQVPICGFDAKNAVLCPQCESRIESGDLTKADAQASITLAQLAKEHTQIDQFRLFGCKEIDGDFILHFSKEDIQCIRQSRTLYRIIQEKFPGKIWIVEAGENNERFIQDLFFPTRILSFNSVWAPGGVQKTKAVVSGKWTPRFPINVNKVAQIVKNARNIDIEIEFEESRRK